jgi:threonine dehydrogenase-like Zn-dependent dehydrogenase
MRATMLTAVRGIELRQVADPAIHFGTDAIVTVTASCVCGSDLHGYRGHAATVFPRRIGHEFIGVVSETGSEVTTVAVGDLVIAPFAISDGTCPHCRNGVTTSCAQGSFWGPVIMPQRRPESNRAARWSSSATARSGCARCWRQPVLALGA